MNKKELQKATKETYFVSAFLKIGCEFEMRMVMGRLFHSPEAAKEKRIYFERLLFGFFQHLFMNYCCFARCKVKKKTTN